MKRLYSKFSQPNLKLSRKVPGEGTAEPASDFREYKQELTQRSCEDRVSQTRLAKTKIFSKISCFE